MKLASLASNDRPVKKVERCKKANDSLRSSPQAFVRSKYFILVPSQKLLL